MILFFISVNFPPLKSWFNVDLLWGILPSESLRPLTLSASLCSTSSRPIEGALVSARMVSQIGKGGFPLFGIMNESLLFDFIPELVVIKHYQ